MEPVKAKRTVLVVEDEKMLLEAITKKLQVSGLDVVSCLGGTQALDYLKTMTPDAIWLDYHLQDMDGLFFMGKLKEDPHTQQIPVIVVSNSASQDKVNSMLALGAEQYVLKAEHRLDDIITSVIKLIEESKVKNG